MAEELKTAKGSDANGAGATGADAISADTNGKDAKAKDTKFLQYKGYPLVRNKDEIYYGNMNDKYVVWMQIIEKTRIGDLEVASKIKIYKMATDEKLSPMEAIKKTSEKKSLYEALDIAYAWLSRN